MHAATPVSFQVPERLKIPIVTNVLKVEPLKVEKKNTRTANFYLSISDKGGDQAYFRRI